LRDTGLPYSEQQTTLRGLGVDADRQAQQQLEDEQLQMDNDIYGATSFPGHSLASAADAPIEVVHDITTNPNFPTYAANVEGAIAEYENSQEAQNSSPAERENGIAAAADAAIRDAMAQVVQATGDQTTAEVLERILRSLYNI